MAKLPKSFSRLTSSKTRIERAKGIRGSFAEGLEEGLRRANSIDPRGTIKVRRANATNPDPRPEPEHETLPAAARGYRGDKPRTKFDQSRHGPGLYAGGVSLGVDTFRDREEAGEVPDGYGETTPEGAGGLSGLSRKEGPVPADTAMRAKQQESSQVVSRAGVPADSRESAGDTQTSLQGGRGPADTSALSGQQTQQQRQEQSSDSRYGTTSTSSQALYASRPVTTDDGELVRDEEGNVVYDDYTDEEIDELDRENRKGIAVEYEDGPTSREMQEMSPEYKARLRDIYNADIRDEISRAEADRRVDALNKEFGVGKYGRKVKSVEKVEMGKVGEAEREAYQKWREGQQSYNRANGIAAGFYDEDLPDTRIYNMGGIGYRLENGEKLFMEDEDPDSTDTEGAITLKYGDDGVILMP